MAINGDRYWMSRSFVVVMSAILGSFVLAYLLDSETIATVIIPVTVTAWFGGKVFKKDPTNGRQENAHRTD